LVDRSAFDVHPDVRAPEGCEWTGRAPGNGPDSTGSSSRKVEPCPSLDSTQIVPPMRWTSSLQM